jgi:hypothetical protein
MYLRSTHPGIDVKEVREMVQWDLNFDDDVETTPVPTRREVAMLRTIDPTDTVLRDTDRIYEIEFDEWADTMERNWKRLMQIEEDK